MCIRDRWAWAACDPTTNYRKLLFSILQCFVIGARQNMFPDLRKIIIFCKNNEHKHRPPFWKSLMYRCDVTLVVISRPMFTLETPPPSCYSPCYSLCKMVGLGQKVKMPNTAEKPLYKNIRFVLCKRLLKETPDIPSTFNFGMHFSKMGLCSCAKGFLRERVKETLSAKRDERDTMWHSDHVVN